MSKAARPSLATLGDRLAKKTSAPAATPEPVADAKEERVQVLVRMSPGERKSLKMIALEQDTTIQALVEEAIRDTIRRHRAS